MKLLYVMTLGLISKKKEASDVYSFIFHSEEDFGWKPGQFLMYRVEHPNPDERGERRYFSIASAPFEKQIILTTRFDRERGSSFKKVLFGLPIGSTIYAEGPRGSFVIDDPTGNCVFIAGGIGVTPFRAILLDLDYQRLPINAILLYASRTNDIVYKEEFDQLAKRHSDLKIHYIVPPNYLDEIAIRKYVPDLAKLYFYISGPKPMVVDFEELLPGMGVPAEHIKRDYFPGYDRL